MQAESENTGFYRLSECWPRSTSRSEPVDPWLCDIDSMTSGITLASWFKDETQRIYHLLTESQGDRDLRQAAEWIRQHGGTVRARDLVSGRRDITDVEQADDLLQQLVKAEFGFWRMVASGERGGQPTMECCLQNAD
jgi:hypothetical protein